MHFSRVAILALSGLASASPSMRIARDDPDLDINGAIMVPTLDQDTGLERRSLNSYCNVDDLLSTFQVAEKIDSASVFCSGYLQPTTTVVVPLTAFTTMTTLVIQTNLRTTTTTSIAIATLTKAYDPICGQSGYGTAANVIKSFNDVDDPARCRALSELVPGCESFGHGNGQCVAYSSNVADNIISDMTPYGFYDVSCKPVSVVKRDGYDNAPVPTCAPNPSSVPADLCSSTDILEYRYSSACSCLVDTASATCTVTSTQTSLVPAYITATTTSDYVASTDINVKTFTTCITNSPPIPSYK